MKISLIFSFLLIPTIIYSQGNFNLEWESPATVDFQYLCKSLEKDDSIPELIFKEANTYKVFDGNTKAIKYSIQNMTDGSRIEFPDAIYLQGTYDGGGPNDIPIDINNDGIYDLINHNSFSQGPTFLKILNTISGQVLHEINFTNPIQFCFIDIDGDGYIELCTSFQTGPNVGKLYIYSTPSVVSIKENIFNVKEFILKQNYPNPFNPNTIIEYNLIKNSNVKIIVYDILGKEVKTIIDQNQNVGTYKISLQGTDLSSGTYFYNLIVDGASEVKKMILVK